MSTAAEAEQIFACTCLLSSSVPLVQSKRSLSVRFWCDVDSHLIFLTFEL